MSAVPVVIEGNKLLTAEEFARLPDPEDGSKQELVRGEVVTMSPPGFLHGWVQGQVYFALETYARATKLGRVTVESGVIVARGKDTVRGPDVAFWSFARLPLDRTPRVFAEIGADLTVEVRSPDNTPRRIALKVREYFTGGTLMVWVVDPEASTVTVYRKPSEGKVLWDDATLSGDDVMPGFACPVAEFFPAPTAEGSP